MGSKIPEAFIAAVIMTCVCIGIMIYFLRREQKLTGRIQKMLDDAIEGKFQDENLNESKISAIENSMWRYLCDRQVSYQNLSGEKEQIQALISDISHQTVTPIANIVLYSQLLEEWLASGKDDDKLETAEEIAAIREQAEKLDFLVESLVRLSRMETGLIRVNVQKQKIAPVIRAVMQQFVPKAALKGIQLTAQDTDETAVFDQRWTIEALANIVDNAVKYTPEGGVVSIRAEAYPFFTRIDVEDNGIGISEEEQAGIFTRFYRSEAVSEKQGLGLGLYLAREVMKAQHGYIKLTSNVGEGSVFSLFLLNEEMSQK